MSAGPARIVGVAAPGPQGRKSGAVSHLPSPPVPRRSTRREITVLCHLGCHRTVPPEDLALKRSAPGQWRFALSRSGPLTAKVAESLSIRIAQHFTHDTLVWHIASLAKCPDAHSATVATSAPRPARGGSSRQERLEVVRLGAGTRRQQPSGSPAGRARRACARRSRGAPRARPSGRRAARAASLDVARKARCARLRPPDRDAASNASQRACSSYLALASAIAASHRRRRSAAARSRSSRRCSASSRCISIRRKTRGSRSSSVMRLGPPALEASPRPSGARVREWGERWLRSQEEALQMQVTHSCRA